MNYWLKKMHEDLKQELMRAVKPVEQYLEQFNDLVPILKMRPE